MQRSLVWWSVIAGIAVVAIAASGFLFSREACRDFKAGTLQVNGQEMKVALAISEVERSRGLGGCMAIPERSGMYFPYDEPREVMYWMKGMVIPIDIVWINNGQVIGIERSVPIVEKTTVDPPRYSPGQPVTGVLELGANKAAEYGIDIGASIVLLPAS